jgi:hypothetical protein
MAERAADNEHKADPSCGALGLRCRVVKRPSPTCRRTARKSDRVLRATALRLSLATRSAGRVPADTRHQRWTKDDVALGHELIKGIPKKIEM